MLRVWDGKRNVHFEGAVGTSGENGDAIAPSSCFRTGSITKPFTATLVLQLVEQGALKLDDLYFDLLNETTRAIISRMHLCAGVDYTAEIKVLHLLQHSSGLRDYFADDERFLAYVMQHPDQHWNWKSVLEKYFEYGLNDKALFVPGNGFYYSDTNYLLLGILIEQITGKSLHQNYEEQILIPLGLTDTYLEFFQASKGTAALTYPYYGNVSLKNTNTSFDWGGGGLVSSMKDLDTFIRALVSGRLFTKEETWRAMAQFDFTDPVHTSAKRSLYYGLGVQKKSFSGYSFIGHNSAYAAMLYYDPEKDLSIVLSLNQAGAVHKAEWLLNKIAGIMQQ
jgi:D-alanyl-D-alanine carboxypeptidase